MADHITSTIEAGSEQNLKNPVLSGSDTRSSDGNRANVASIVAAVLFVASLSLSLIIGDIGFQGDDWWELSWPHWYSFPQSSWECVKQYSRPVESLYYVLMYESFGLSRIFYTLTSLLLLAGSCFILVKCLQAAFPRRMSLALFAGIFAFFLTPISNLVYMWHTDNSRLANLFFLFSVYAFQRWAMSSGSWTRLFLPSFCYLLACFTYENSTLMIFGVPLLVWPVYVISKPSNLTTRKFAFRLGSGVVGSFAIFVIARFLVFGGGAVKQSSLIPPINLVLSYFRDIVIYTSYPFTNPPSDPGSWLWAIPIAIVVAVSVFRFFEMESVYHFKFGGFEQSSTYIACIGVFFLILGMAPYLLAGYTSSIGFTSQSRIYSSATYGLAILLGLLASSGSSPRVRLALRATGVIAICFMAVFLASLKNEWQEAQRQRAQLCRSLLKQVPGVESNTTFLFLNLQSYISKNGVDRAVVFQGVDGLVEWVRMLYGKRNIRAYFLYSRDDVSPDDKEERTAIVSKSGIVARGSATSGPIPLNALLICDRRANQLQLLDGLSQGEDVASLEWRGISKITSNRKLILSEAEAAGEKMRMCGE